MTLIAVSGREDKRRDGVLSCTRCSRLFVAIHFYQNDMNGLMDILNVSHYDKCGVAEAGGSVVVSIAWDQPAPRTRFLFDREKRKLKQF